MVPHASSRTRLMHASMDSCQSHVLRLLNLERTVARNLCGHLTLWPPPRMNLCMQDRDIVRNASCNLAEVACIMNDRKHTCTQQPASLACKHVVMPIPQVKGADLSHDHACNLYVQPQGLQANRHWAQVCNADDDYEFAVGMVQLNTIKGRCDCLLAWINITRWIATVLEQQMLPPPPIAELNTPVARKCPYPGVAALTDFSMTVDSIIMPKTCTLGCMRFLTFLASVASAPECTGDGISQTEVIFFCVLSGPVTAISICRYSYFCVLIVLVVRTSRYSALTGFKVLTDLLLPCNISCKQQFGTVVQAITVSAGLGSHAQSSGNHLYHATSLCDCSLWMPQLRAHVVSWLLHQVIIFARVQMERMAQSSSACGEFLRCCMCPSST